MNSRYLLFIVFALWAFFSHGQAFYLDSNGVTIKCPLANVGDTGVVGSDTYVKVDRASLVASITAGANVQFCCTSGITDMSELFSARNSFNKNIGGWDTASATTMREMFRSAHLFNQDIGEWDVSNVSNMNDMFKRWPACDGGCARMIFDRDISSWCVQQFTSTPSGFNDNANTPIRAEYLPRWGESCGAKVILTDSDGDDKLTDAETAIITATFDKDMNVSPQYKLTGGAYTNLSSTADPKIWTLLLDATPLTPGDYTVTVTGNTTEVYKANMDKTLNEFIIINSFDLCIRPLDKPIRGVR